MPGALALSPQLRSSATTALAKARQRLPLAWLVVSWEQMAQTLVALVVASPPKTLPVRLLDGSILRLRPHGNILRHFPAHRTRRQRSDWCVARTVVCFCADSAVALSGQIGSIHLSEQALAVRLAGNRRLKPSLDLVMDWVPSRHDQVNRGLKQKAVAVRLVVVRVQRRGWRTQTLILFTTLTDASAYPPTWLLE